jgi:hypothetical protein
MINHQLDALNAALQIVGQRLLEAERVHDAASKVEKAAWKELRSCHDDAETLLKLIRDLSGGKGSQSVPVGSPEVTRIGLRYHVYVDVSGHKGSLKKAEAVRRRICGDATAAMPAGD